MELIFFLDVMERLLLEQIDYFVRKFNICLRELGSLYLSVKDFIDECSSAQVDGAYEGFVITHGEIVPFTNRKLVESVICILPFLDRIDYEIVEILLPLYRNSLFIEIPALYRKLITRRMIVLFTHVDGLFEIYKRCRSCLPIAQELEVSPELTQLMKQYQRAVNYLSFSQLGSIREKYLKFLEDNHIDIEPKHFFCQHYKDTLPLITEQKIILVLYEDRELRRLLASSTHQSYPPPPPPPS